jgi:hypothetical protein
MSTIFPAHIVGRSRGFQLFFGVQQEAKRFLPLLAVLAGADDLT